MNALKVHLLWSKRTVLYCTVHVHLLYSTSAFINRYFALRQEGSEAALKRSNPFEWI